MHKLYIKNPKIKKDEKGNEQQYNWLQKVRNMSMNNSIDHNEREQRGQRKRVAKKTKKRQRKRVKRATKEGCKKEEKRTKRGKRKRGTSARGQDKPEKQDGKLGERKR